MLTSSIEPSEPHTPNALHCNMAMSSGRSFAHKPEPPTLPPSLFLPTLPSDFGFEDRRLELEDTVRRT